MSLTYHSEIGWCKSRLLEIEPHSCSIITLLPCAFLYLQYLSFTQSLCSVSGSGGWVPTNRAPNSFIIERVKYSINWLRFHPITAHRCIHISLWCQCLNTCFTGLDNQVVKVFGQLLEQIKISSMNPPVCGNGARSVSTAPLKYSRCCQQSKGHVRELEFA